MVDVTNDILDHPCDDLDGKMMTMYQATFTKRCELDVITDCLYTLLIGMMTGLIIYLVRQFFSEKYWPLFYFVL